MIEHPRPKNGCETTVLKTLHPGLPTSNANLVGATASNNRLDEKSFIRTEIKPQKVAYVQNHNFSKLRGKIIICILTLEIVKSLDLHYFIISDTESYQISLFLH